MKRSPKTKGCHCVWANVEPETPWHEWWPEICSALQWPGDLEVEKWAGKDLSWSQLIDSANTFSLFKKHKAIVIQDADKFVKGEKELQKYFDRFNQGPHYVIFVSNTDAPKKTKIEKWQSRLGPETRSDDKAAFKWIDAIHNLNLTNALIHLENAISSGQHPLALLQLVNRDYRLGRLIHHALKSKLQDDEIASTLRLHSFVIRKWSQRKNGPLRSTSSSLIALSTPSFAKRSARSRFSTLSSRRSS